jgi:hypothetical protein
VSRAVGLAALLLVAALLVSRPLVLEWRDALPLAARAPADTTVLTRYPGDVLQLYYQAWLVKDGLVGPTPLFRDPYQFRVNGPRWNLPQTFLPVALPFTLLAGLGPIAAYNALVWLSFPLSGLAAYALTRRYTGDPRAAAVAGVAYALLPARLGPLFGGQPAGFAAALVPCALWGLDVALVDRRVRGGLLGGAAFLGLAMLEPHYTYLTAGLAVLAAAVRWLGLPPPRRPAALPLAVFAALAAAGAGWLLMLRQAFLVGSIAEAGRGLGEVRLFSQGPAALLVPATYGGVLVLALALVGLAAPGRSRRVLALGYGLVLATGLVLSLGPTLPGFPLYQALHRWAPLFALIRNPEKFRLLTSVGAVVLAAFGARVLLARLDGRVRAAGLALVLAVALETAPWHAIAVTRLPENPLYASLRRDARRVLYLPVWPGDSAWSSLYLYHATRTRVPMVNGYSPLVPRAYVSDVFGPLQGLNVGDFGRAEHRRLRALGITHVVLDRGGFPPQVSPFPSSFTRDRLREAAGLRLERALDPLWLYRVTEEPPTDQPAPTTPVGLFYEAEALLRGTGEVGDEPAASGRRTVRARPGMSPGFLTFGPYRPLPAGRYRATFRVRGSGLTAEVSAEEGRRVLASRAIEPRAAWDDVDLEFEVLQAQAVEYRLRWSGAASADADWVLVVFADRPQPEWTYEVEQLPHQLGERPDRAASAGWAGYADPAESRQIALVSGPSRLYPPGRYRLTLRARATHATAGPLLRLTVTEPAGQTVAGRTVDAGEVAPGAYREVSLDFTLPGPMVVEFPVVYLGDTGVYFDRLVVTPADSGLSPPPPRPFRP